MAITKRVQTLMLDHTSGLDNKTLVIRIGNRYFINNNAENNNAMSYDISTIPKILHMTSKDNTYPWESHWRTMLPDFQI